MSISRSRAAAERTSGTAKRLPVVRYKLRVVQEKEVDIGGVGGRETGGRLHLDLGRLGVHHHAALEDLAARFAGDGRRRAEGDGVADSTQRAEGGVRSRGLPRNVGGKDVDVEIIARRRGRGRGLRGRRGMLGTWRAGRARTVRQELEDWRPWRSAASLGQDRVVATHFASPRRYLGAAADGCPPASACDACP